MPASNYSGGFNGGLIVQEIPMLGNFPGTILWVNSAIGSDSNHGTFKKPYATLAHALSIGNTVNRPLAGVPSQVIILCMPGHVENVGTAGLTFSASAPNNAGVDVYFLGGGTNRATISLNATAAQVLISAANVRLFRPRFLAGHDAIVAGLQVNAANFEMVDAEWYDAAAMATLIQVLTTANANYMKLRGYRYFAGTTGTQKTAGIQIVGGAGIELTDVSITANLTNAPIYNLTTACTDLLVQRAHLNNLNATPELAVACLTTSTGLFRDCDFIVASGTTFVTASNKFVWDNCYGAIPGATGALKP